MLRTGTAFTAYGWLLCLWILLVPFQYGYHISILNQVQDVLTCNTPAGMALDDLLPGCIPMDDFTFSVITSIFTLGGLVGSLVANLVMDKHGRKGAATGSSVLVALGTGMMGTNANLYAFGIGRFFVGVGCGLGICVGPIYLAEIAPLRISGTVGVLTQLSIVLGIFLTQLIGLKFATPTAWRYPIFFSFILSAIQWLSSIFISDTPSWLVNKGLKDAASVAGGRIWGSGFALVDGQESEASSLFDAEPQPDNPLLSEPDESQRIIHSRTSTLNDPDDLLSLPALLLKAPADVHKPMLIVCSALIAQQISGINAVLYYSNKILSKTLPDIGPYVSLGITIVNVIMTFPPIILIEKVGRRQLLTISAAGAIVSLVIVGISLDIGLPSLASAGILTFVMSFAVGLGPIPFVMIPEVSPFYAVSALSSLALSLNWIVNFLVGLVFLPLRNLLSGGDADKEGRVFWVFAILLAFFMGIVRVSYRG